MSFALLVVASSVSAAVVHPARQAHIDAVNAAATTWRAAAHPRFAAAPPGASAPMLGAKGDMKLEVAAAKARGDVVDYVPRGGAAPEAFDSAARWPACAKLIGDIRDQSNCGCCWAFAGAEAASDRQCIATGGAVAVPLSAQDVCFNANVDGCDGGQIVTPWTYVAKTGAVTLETWKRYELALKRRDACEGPLPFETYLASMKTERAKAEKVVEEWTKSKDEEEKLRKEDRMRRAPVDKVVDEMRSLYDLSLIHI